LGGFGYALPSTPPPPMASMPAPNTPYLAPVSKDLKALRGFGRSASPNIFAKAKDAISRLFGKNQPTEVAEFENEEKRSLNVPAASHHQLEVVSATGLDPAGIVAITQYLQQLKLPTGFSGVIVFDFTVKNGRVGRIVLDEEASTLLEKTVVGMIKRSLTAWNCPPLATGKVRLTLQLK
jgi:hypothetical protein